MSQEIVTKLREKALADINRARLEFLTSRSRQRAVEPPSNADATKVTTLRQQKWEHSSGFSAIDAMFIVACCGVLAWTTGCSGMEVGGKLGVYAVDEHQEGTRAYRRPPSLICLFKDCSASASEAPAS